MVGPSQDQSPAPILSPLPWKSGDMLQLASQNRQDWLQQTNGLTLSEASSCVWYFSRTWMPKLWLDHFWMLIKLKKVGWSRLLIYHSTVQSLFSKKVVSHLSFQIKLEVFLQLCWGKGDLSHLSRGPGDGGSILCPHHGFQINKCLLCHKCVSACLTEITW